MGKSTISMAMFNSYVCLPDGIFICWWWLVTDSNWSRWLVVCQWCLRFLVSFGGKRWVKTTHADKFRPLASFSTGWFGFSNTTPDNMACEMDGCKDEAPSGCESGGDISCADGQNMIFQMKRGDVNILCEYIMCIYGLYMYVLCIFSPSYPSFCLRSPGHPMPRVNVHSIST